MSRVAGSCLVGLSCLLPAAALACRCVPQEFRQAYKHASVVAVAKVESVVPNLNSEGSVATLRVMRSWKLKLAERVSAMTATNCAFPWEASKDYLLYLHLDKSRVLLSTTRCEGNTPLDEAQSQLQWLEKMPRAGLE